MSEKPTYKIYIDTTERYSKEVKLVEVVGDKEKKIDGITGDLDTVSAIKEILEKNSLKPEDVEEFEPNTGPGSFTGIKIGVTISNILNWALGKEKKPYKPNYGKEPNIQK